MFATIPACLLRSEESAKHWMHLHYLLLSDVLVTSLKKGVDLFLSEDFHFTSQVTEKVMEDITSSACLEYRQMCDEELFAIDTGTFLEAYGRGKLDLGIVESRKESVRKPGKMMG